jgi:spore coat protein U-like protein
MQRQLRLRSVLIVVILTTVAAERRAHAASAMPGGGACMVESTPIVFGNYNPIRRKDLATVGMIHYRCLGSHQRLTIGLSPGDSGSFAARVMSRGQRSITYNLYLDPAATQVWGDGTRGAQAYVVYSPRVNTEVSIPIYGRMRGGQNASAGGYRDNLSLIVSY